MASNLNLAPIHSQVPDAIVAVAQPEIDAVYQRFLNFVDKLDINNMPDSWLVPMTNWLNWPLVDYSINTLHTAIPKIPQWKKSFGKAGVLESIIQHYAGIEVTCEPRNDNDGCLRIGSGRIGVSRIYDLFSNNGILITIQDTLTAQQLTDATDAINAIMDKVLMPWCTWTIITL